MDFMSGHMLQDVIVRQNFIKKGYTCGGSHAQLPLSIINLGVQQCHRNST